MSLERHSLSLPPPTNLCILAPRKGKLSQCVLAVLISVSFILCSIPLLPPLLFWLSVSSCLHISLLCLTPLSSSPFTLSVLFSGRRLTTCVCVCVCVHTCSSFLRRLMRSMLFRALSQHFLFHPMLFVRATQVS